MAVIAGASVGSFALLAAAASGAYYMYGSSSPTQFEDSIFDAPEGVQDPAERDARADANAFV